MTPTSTARAPRISSRDLATVGSVPASVPDDRQRVQDLKAFRLPANFRGRPAWFVQLWWIVQSTLFRGSPQVFYGWRRFLLRLFGCSLGKGVLVRATAEITYPWKVSIGDYS